MMSFGDEPLNPRQERLTLDPTIQASALKTDRGLLAFCL